VVKPEDDRREQEGKRGEHGENVPKKEGTTDLLQKKFEGGERKISDFCNSNSTQN